MRPTTCSTLGSMPHSPNRHPRLIKTVAESGRLHHSAAQGSVPVDERVYRERRRHLAGTVSSYSTRSMTRELEGNGGEAKEVICNQAHVRRHTGNATPIRENETKMSPEKGATGGGMEMTLHNPCSAQGEAKRTGKAATPTKVRKERR